MKVVLSRRYKYRRYSLLLVKSALSVSVTSAVIDIIVPMIGRTTILVYAAIPNIARIRLSGHYNISAVGRVL